MKSVCTLYDEVHADKIYSRHDWQVRNSDSANSKDNRNLTSKVRDIIHQKEAASSILDSRNLEFETSNSEQEKVVILIGPRVKPGHVDRGYGNVRVSENVQTVRDLPTCH